MKKLMVSKDTLVLISKALVNAVLIDLLFFQSSQTRYTKAFLDTVLDLAKTVDGLPDLAKRVQDRKEARIFLIGALPGIRTMIDNLKRHIAKAYPTESTDQLNIAGITANYKPAFSRNWTSLKDLLIGSVDFVKKNEAVLIASGDMPALYLASLTEKTNAVLPVIEKFQTANTDVEQKTATVAVQTQALNDLVVSIFADAQAVFSQDAEKRKFYTFTNFKMAVAPSGPGGIRIKFINAANMRPIAQGMAHMPYFDKKTESDKTGTVEFNQLSAGTYSFDFEPEGFPKVTVTDIVVETGKFKRYKPIEVAPIVPGNPESAKPIVVKAEKR